MHLPYAFRLWPILCLLCATACVEPLEADLSGENLPLINAVLTNSPGQRSIRISQTDGLSLIPIPMEANGTVFKDGVAVAELVYLERGLLKLPDEFVIEAGHAYHLELQTADGKNYHSVPQQVFPLPASPVQTLSWERNVILDEEVETSLPINVVDVFASVDISPEENRYYRWEVAETWEHKEEPKPEVDTMVVIDSSREIGFPGWIYDTMIIIEEDPILTCYPSRETFEFPSVVLRTDALQEGQARIKVHQTEIGQSFLFRHYFRVYLHRITLEAYDYYNKSRRLVDITGELYDEVPAAVNGNLLNPEDSSARVLGFVEFSLADTVRMSLTADDVGITLQDDCRPLSGDNVCITETTNPPPPPCKCWDCDSVYGLNTVFKPSWWIE